MEYVRGLELIRNPELSNGARDRGTIVHIGVAALYEGRDWRVALMEEMVKHPASPEWIEHFALAAIMLEGYEQWLAETAADANESVLLVEPQLEYEIGTFHGDTVIFTGRPDTVKHDDLTDQFIVEDTKTVQQIEPVMIHGFQGKSYALLLKLIYDMDVSIFRTNQLRKVKRTARAHPPFYGRAEMFINPEALRHHHQHLMGQLDTMVELMQYWERKGLSDRFEYDTLFYPTPQSTCSWDCDFLAVCKAMDDGSNFEYIIRNHYQPKPETPIEVDASE
jgi:hypothetical protein